MNYYEQFYDDLEFVEYDEDPYRRGNRSHHDDYYEAADHFYRGQGHSRSHIDEGQYFRGDRGRGEDDYYDRGPERRFNEREQVARGRRQFDRGRGQSDRGRGHSDRGRGHADRGRGHSDRDRGHSDRGRGQGHTSRGRESQERGRGGTKRGRAAQHRGTGGERSNRGAGQYGMNFVKAGELMKPEEAEDKKSDENVKTEAGGSDTIRFDYKSYQSQRSETEKEVELALKAYSSQLGFGYGYGPRSDLIDGTPEAPTWIGQEGEEMVYETQPPAPCEAVPTITPGSQPQMAQESKTVVKKAMVNPAFNFVKAQSEFKSTDVAFHEVPTEELKPKVNSLSVNMGNKRIGLGFGMSAKSGASSVPSADISEKFYQGMKDGCNPRIDRRFALLHQSVKAKNLPNKNGIEVLHMAVDKIKMGVNDEIRAGGRTPAGQPVFTCRLEIDGVFISEGRATAKKAAKHDAYTNAVKLLMTEPLTVKEVSKGVFELKQKGPEFKIPVSPALKTATQSKSSGQTFVPGQFQNVSSQGGLLSNMPKTETLNKQPQHSKVSIASTSSTTPAMKMAYTKPKIVFHKASHPLSDSPLEFKTPTAQFPTLSQCESYTNFVETVDQADCDTPSAYSGETQNSHQPMGGVKNPEAMAMKLLTFVKEGETAGANNVSKTANTPHTSYQSNNMDVPQEENGPPSLFEPRRGNMYQEPANRFQTTQQMSSMTTGQVHMGPSRRGRMSSTVCMVNSSNIANRKRPYEKSGGRGGGQGRLKVKKHGSNRITLDDLSEFIIIDTTDVNFFQNVTPLTTLHNSANFNKVVLKVEYEDCTDGVNCSFIIADHVVATAYGMTMEESKINASKAALDELQEMCYTIRVKQHVDSDGSGLTKEELMSDIQRREEMLPDSNIGSMLLKKMGWVGGGVGKSGQGRAEPVKAEMIIGREGLGLKASQGIDQNFNRRVSKMLEDYTKSDEQKDLHFSSELSKEERAVIHKMGQKMGLKTQSKGKNENRYLIVSRKRSAQELLEHVMYSGGATSKYEVLPPRAEHYDFRKREDIGFGHCKQ